MVGRCLTCVNYPQPQLVDHQNVAIQDAIVIGVKVRVRVFEFAVSFRNTLVFALFIIIIKNFILLPLRVGPAITPRHRTRDIVLALVTGLHSLFGHLVQHLIVISGSGVVKGWVSVLIQGATTIDRWIMSEVLPDHLQLPRGLLSNIGWHRPCSPLLHPSFDQLSPFDKSPVRVEMQEGEV